MALDRHNSIYALVRPIFDAERNRTNLTLAQVRTDLAVIDYKKVIQVVASAVPPKARGGFDDTSR
ncbi:hypothetical protein RGU77_05200 [Actimicrobium sp. CCI2.3]|nr:hypothetical protein [Actimicrobium sp. CCI2.3]MDY7573685.1 hypothetical protein [Actimicrobium sp. CCI2.3]